MITKSEFDNHCSDIIQSVKNEKDYVAEVVNEVGKEIQEYDDSLQSMIARVDGFLSSTDSTFESFENYYKEQKPIVDRLELTEESFLFPKGDAAKVRKNQITALKYANNTIAAYDKAASVNESAEKAVKTHSDTVDKFYKSRLMLRRQQNMTSVKSALLEVMSEHEADECARDLCSASHVAYVKSYEIAKRAVDALKNHNIDAAVVNDSLKTAPEEIFEARKKRIQEEYKDYAKSYVFERWYVNLDVEHIRIWIAAGIITFVSFLVGVMITNVVDSYWFMMLGLLGLASALIAYIGYGIALIKEKKKCDKWNKHVYEEEAHEKKRKEELDKAFDMTKNDFIFAAFSAIDEQVIEKSHEIDKELGDKERALSINVAKIYQEWCKRMLEINYLPSRTPTNLLPKIIEFMETGMAADYQSAVWQAVQDNKAEIANEKLLFEQKMANIRQDRELRRQGEMQEEYNRERLAEAKRATAAAQQQAEAALRTERYAAEQAAAAQRSEKYAAEQAKAARETADLQEKIANNSEKAADYLKKIKDA